MDRRALPRHTFERFVTGTQLRSAHVVVNEKSFVRYNYAPLAQRGFP